MAQPATIKETLTTPVAGSFDVIVVGGGASGTVAAMAAAREGARTLVLERGGCLGGAATADLVAQWVAFFTATPASLAAFRMNLRSGCRPQEAPTDSIDTRWARRRIRRSP